MEWSSLKHAVVWFRGILRLHDNPPFFNAANRHELQTILPIYIIDEADYPNGFSNMGDKRRKFLYDSLIDLDQSLRDEYGQGLTVFQGNPSNLLRMIFQNLGPGPNYLFTDYMSEPWKREELDNIEVQINEIGAEMISFPAVNTILDIEETVMSEIYKNPKSMKDIQNILTHRLENGPEGIIVGDPLPAPKSISYDSSAIQKLNSDTKISDQIVPLAEIKRRSNLLGPSSYFPGGETEALRRLKNKVSERRDFVNSFSKPKTLSTNEAGLPSEPSTTGLSPYLSTGCLSPRVLWKEVTAANLGSKHTKPPTSLHGQLMFREMFHLLSRSVNNWDDDKGNSNCKPIEWGQSDPEALYAWESGMTGFPLIDAMMRQLSTTGWMHHLGRHAVSCFLTRGQLWQNWKHGRDVFERKLLDSDWAVNNGNWLWLAGVAPFSMPYYRVYNPCPDGKSSLNVDAANPEFIRHWVPELSSFPSKYIFEPHLAPIDIQESSKCIIGLDYPLPIVDRKESRRVNIDSFKKNLARIAGKN